MGGRQGPAGGGGGADGEGARGWEVRPRRSSCEAGEQRGAIRRGDGGAKGRGRGECEPAQHGPSTETGNRVTGVGAHTASSKAKDRGEVHHAPPSHQHDSHRTRVPRTQEVRGTGSV